MRTLRSLLLIAAALIFMPLCASAEETTNGPGTNATQQQQQPDPGQQQNQQTKTTARKEDEDDAAPKSKGFNLASLRQYLPTTRKGAGNAHARVVELEAENKTLSDRIKALEDGAALKALTETNNQMRRDLEAFALAAQERGLFDESADAGTPEAQSREGKAVNAIINGAVAKEIRSIGYDSSKKAPEGASAAAADTAKLTSLQLISIGRAKQKQTAN